MVIKFNWSGYFELSRSGLGLTPVRCSLVCEMRLRVSRLRDIT